MTIYRSSYQFSASLFVLNSTASAAVLCLPP
jgi:hypothetical protein